MSWRDFDDDGYIDPEELEEMEAADEREIDWQIDNALDREAGIC